MFALNIALAVMCLVGEGTMSPSSAHTDSLTHHLDEVTVTSSNTQYRQSEHTQATVRVDHTWLAQHDAGSLAATLQHLPGVQSMSVGSSQAKPMIRGLGFNRCAVIHDGIRHEGQQWGDDHGLEIDRFTIDRLEVLKGPAALLYGADAIGGALVLSSVTRPTETLSGSAQLFMHTNNMLFGGSLRLEGKRQKFFWRANLTYQDYADMQVPTDSINYYSYRIPLYHRTLRNTAGREADGSITLGYADYHWHTCLKIYETYAESGFFANAHGLEVRLSQINYDLSRRDIDLPKQSVNHLKVLSHSVYQQDDWSIESNIAWQYNIRREDSEPISHGYMPAPTGTLERGFDKHTATLNLSARWAVHDQHTLRFGLNGELQHNRRSGWGFIIPDFEQYSLGLYAAERWQVNSHLSLNAGLRYDYAHTHIHPYNDWYKTPISNADSAFVQRSSNLHRNFHSVTWSVGVQYLKDDWELKANIGKGFRVPIAKELGANGINYHIFRYEEGNANLRPEVSYQLDLSAGYHGEHWQAQLDPYVGYFPNYIYLNPTPDYHEGLQLYRYTEAKVLRTGFEAMLVYSPLRWLEMSLQGDYLFARQLSGTKRGYGLPFSPPWRLTPEMKFSWFPNSQLSNSKFLSGFAAVNVRIAGAQNDIVPPEKPTPSWWTLNLSLSQQIALHSTMLNLSVSADNILNTCYYDHTSYYRLIDVPEAGWNVSINIGVEF